MQVKLPVGVAISFVGCFYHTDITQFVCYCSMIETAHNCVWLLLSNLFVEQQKAINAATYLLNIESRVLEAWFALFGESKCQFALACLRQQLS